METAEKIRENRLRRMADRQLLILRKSPRRDRRAHDYGRYWLLNGGNSSRIEAGGDHGMTLDEVERFLTSEVAPSG